MGARRTTSVRAPSCSTSSAGASRRRSVAPRSSTGSTSPSTRPDKLVGGTRPSARPWPGSAPRCAGAGRRPPRRPAAGRARCSAARGARARRGRGARGEWRRAAPGARRRPNTSARWRCRPAPPGRTPGPARPRRSTPAARKCLHAGRRVVGAPVAELRDAHAEQRIELRQVLRRALERHQPHARRDCTGGGQRAHQIEAAHLDDRPPECPGAGAAIRRWRPPPRPTSTGARACSARTASTASSKACATSSTCACAATSRCQPREHAAQAVAGHGHDVRGAALRDEGLGEGLDGGPDAGQGSIVHLADLMSQK
jgi:hypothetical protein